MQLECNENCVHLDVAKGICKEWFRSKLAFTVKDEIKVFMKCEECRAIEDDVLFAEIMRRESFICKP